MNRVKCDMIIAVEKMKYIRNGLVERGKICQTKVICMSR